MREIKFRTFDKESKEYNNPYHSHWIYLNDPFKCEWFNDRFIIEQFTGLYDSEGNEIYEGDVIQAIGHKFEYYIVFENAAFVCYHTKQKHYDGSPYRWRLLHRITDADFFDRDWNFLVIGNINENPELLK